MSHDFAHELSRAEAVVKLQVCTALAARLDSEGLNLELTGEDREILSGFKQVLLAGYLEGNSHIYRQANLSRKDIAALSRLLSRTQDQSMRHLYDTGND